MDTAKVKDPSFALKEKERASSLEQIKRKNHSP